VACEELAEVAPVHGDASHDVVSSAISSSISPRIGPQSPRSQVTVSLRPSGPCGLSGGASYEGGVDELVGRGEVAAFEELLEEPPRNSLVLI
jgi:hypothetical protein